MPSFMLLLPAVRLPCEAPVFSSAWVWLVQQCCDRQGGGGQLPPLIYFFLALYDIIACAPEVIVLFGVVNFLGTSSAFFEVRCVA